MTQLELIEHIEKQLRDMLADLGRMKAELKRAVVEVNGAKSLTLTPVQKVLAATTTNEMKKTL